jgi:mono/diheme cytochrome c family protein
MRSSTIGVVVLIGALSVTVAGVCPFPVAAAQPAPARAVASVNRVAAPEQRTPGRSASPRSTPPGVNRYAEICQVCHQATGLGLPNVFPPLAGSEWLNGRADIPIAIVLHGVQGEITVKGTTYNSAMAPWASTLNDADLAATLTYARSQWGNRGAAVTAAQVTAVRTKFAARTTPWTAAELRAIR